MAEKFVSLVRVSTSRQGDSGLGLLAQKEQVEQHIRAVGGELVQEFLEVESGRKIKRPMLEEAIALAKAYNATLIIAKWDRISRDAHYLLGLQKSGVKLIAADNPNATELTIGILAVIAQDEAKRISDRVTRALAAAKARSGTGSIRQERQKQVHWAYWYERGLCQSSYSQEAIRQR